MSTVMQINPFEFFADREGDPLDAGYIWIGEANKYPKNFPVTVYYDAALTIPAANPLRTLNGYVVRNGSPTFLYINGNYSILVEDNRSRQIFYVADFFMTGSSPAASATDLANASNPALGSGLVGFTNTGTSAVASTVYRKLTEFHSLFDFMTNAERDDIQSGASVLDHTDALERAIQSGYGINLPDGKINARYVNILDGTRLIGKGHTAGRSGVPSQTGTQIKSLASAETHFMRIPAGHIRGVELRGFSIIGDHVANPGQNGLSMDGIVSGVDGGLWDFNFESLYITGFAQKNFRLAGGTANTQSPMQFGRVSHVIVERPLSTAQSLVLTGQCEHISFEECRFDGVFSLGAVGQGSFMGRNGTDIRPNNITFLNCSFQRADVGIYVDRCENTVFITPWFETVNVAIDQAASSTALDLINPRFANVQIGLRSGSNCTSSIRSPNVSGTITYLFDGNFHAGTTIDTPNKSGIATRNVNYDVPMVFGNTVLNVKGHRFSPHTFTAGHVIDFIDGYHMPGESVTIFVASNACAFLEQPGGNFSLGVLPNPYTAPAGSTITFIRTDTTGLLPWRCISAV